MERVFVHRSRIEQRNKENKDKAKIKKKKKVKKETQGADKKH